MKYLINIFILFVASSLHAQDVLPNKPTESSSKNDSATNRFRHISNNGIIGRDSVIIEGSKSESRLNSTNTKTEWDWAFRCKKTVSKHYPIEETYYVDERHPGYKVYRLGELLYGNELYDDGLYSDGLYIVKDNTLVWVSTVLDWDWNQNSNPTYLLYKKAYSENAYNIKKEKNTVQTYIKYRLGIISSKEYIKYRMPLDDVGIGMRFLEQLEDDFRYLSSSSIEIERKSSTSFEFTDEKGNHFSVSYSLKNAKLKSNFVLLK